MIPHGLPDKAYRAILDTAGLADLPPSRAKTCDGFTFAEEGELLEAKVRKRRRAKPRSELPRPAKKRKHKKKKSKEESEDDEDLDLEAALADMLSQSSDPRELFEGPEAGEDSQADSESEGDWPQEDWHGIDRLFESESEKSLKLPEDPGHTGDQVDPSLEAVPAVGAEVQPVDPAGAIPEPEPSVGEGEPVLESPGGPGLEHDPVDVEPEPPLDHPDLVEPPGSPAHPGGPAESEPKDGRPSERSSSSSSSSSESSSSSSSSSNAGDDGGDAGGAPAAPDDRPGGSGRAPFVGGDVRFYGAFKFCRIFNGWEATCYNDNHINPANNRRCRKSKNYATLPGGEEARWGELQRCVVPFCLQLHSEQGQEGGVLDSKCCATMRSPSDQAQGGWRILRSGIH
eukprot:9485114-Pyramimonas_sp.AAC.1